MTQFIASLLLRIPLRIISKQMFISLINDIQAKVLQIYLCNFRVSMAHRFTDLGGTYAAHLGDCGIRMSRYRLCELDVDACHTGRLFETFIEVIRDGMRPTIYFDRRAVVALIEYLMLLLLTPPRLSLLYSFDKRSLSLSSTSYGLCEIRGAYYYGVDER